MAPLIQGVTTYNGVMKGSQPSFTDAEYSQRRRTTRREEFLTMMDQVIPWDEWIGLIEPVYYNKKRGRRPVPIETMLRMYLLQVWFHLSDEGVEDAVNDSYAMRKFMGLDFTVAQVPDATTLLHFRHLLEDHQLGEAMFTALNRLFEANGWIMRGGTVVDATIIDAPSSTKNSSGTRDPEMHQTKKGNQWFFGMKAHIGVDRDSGLVHTVVSTAANAADVTQTGKLLHGKEKTVYADAGYTGADKREELKDKKIRWNIAERRSRIKALPEGELKDVSEFIEHLVAKVRARVEHPFRVIKRQFGYTKVRYRGLAKNGAQVATLFALSNLWMARKRLLAIAGKVRPQNGKKAVVQVIPA